MNKYIKKIINNKCYIFNVDNILGCRYKINEIFDAETKKNINNIDIYKINESYHDGYSFFTTYDIAFYHDFMELEQWKCFSNGYAGLYVHYDKYDVKKYEYYHINGKINDSYIDNKIKYTYIDGILYEKKVYYDKELKFIKRNIIYKNNIYEGTLYDRQGKCVEQYVNIEKNKHKSKIYKDDKLICECTYIIEYDEYTEYLKNDVYNIKYFIDNYKEYKNDKIHIECNLNNSGKLHGKYIQYYNNDIKYEIIYNDNICEYICEYFDNNIKKLEYFRLDTGENKYIEYYQNGNIRRIYYKINNKFINEYKEYYYNGNIYKECVFTHTKRIINLNIYDFFGNKKYNCFSKTKSFAKSYQTHKFYHINNDLFNIHLHIDKKLYKLLLYIKSFLFTFTFDKNIFNLNYNVLRIMSGLEGLAYSS